MVQDLTALPFDVDDAAAALRGVAADMGTGQPQVLAQKLHQQRARIDVGGDGLPFTVSETRGMALLLEIDQKALFLRSPTGPATFEGGIATFLPRFH